MEDETIEDVKEAYALLFRDMAALRVKADALKDALQDILGCPYYIDEATISKIGLEETMEASPYQVVGNMSMSLFLRRKARIAIANYTGA